MARRRGPGEGSISKRGDGRWMARVELGTDALGKRRRKTLYGATRGEVAAKLRRALQEQEQGTLSARRPATLGAFLETWLTGIEPTIRPRTFQSYQQLSRNHLIPALGRIRLDRLQPSDVEGMLAAERAAGLSAQSVNHLRAVLRTALGKAVRWGLVMRNAAALADPHEVERYQYRVLTPEEATQFLGAIEGTREEALYTVALGLGLRQGEALGLRWQDVDLDRGTLRVSYALQKIGGAWSLVEPKTNRSRRTLTLPSAIVEVLRGHRQAQLEERLVAGSAWRPLMAVGKPVELIFVNRSGGPLDGREVTKKFQRRLAAAGMPRMRFHELRHSAASLLIAQGVPLRTIMDLLGHSTIALTANVYGHLYEEAHRDAATAMDRVLGAKSEG